MILPQVCLFFAQILITLRTFVHFRKVRCFRSKYEMMNGFDLFATIHFPQKVPLDTQIAFTTNLPKKCRQSFDNFLQKKSETDETKCNSFKKQSSKRSFGDAKSSFDKPTGNFRCRSECFLLKI